jgi:predicted O-methyltransferase YrrM
MLKKIFLGIMAVIIFIGAEYQSAHANAEKLHTNLYALSTGAESIKSSSPPKTAEEKKILDVLEDMYQNQRQGMMNVSPEDGKLLRLLTESTGAKHVVEIGTSNGYSAIWFCLALRNTGGKLTTHEIDSGRAALARQNFKRAGVDRIVNLVEGDAHEEALKLKESIDVLFLDADKAGYLDYLNKLLPLVRPGGLIVAHNMRYPPPDPRYIHAVTTNPDLETIFLHMNAAGIGVTLKKR